MRHWVDLGRSCEDATFVSYDACSIALWIGHKVLEVAKDRKPAILGVWASPGAPETLPKGGGLRPPPFCTSAWLNKF